MLRYSAWRTRLIDSGLADFLCVVLRLGVGEEGTAIGRLQEEIRWRLARVARIEGSKPRSEYKDKSGSLKFMAKREVSKLREPLADLEAQIQALQEKAAAREREESVRQALCCPNRNYLRTLRHA